MATLKGISDKISGVTDKYGLANPIEVVNESLGGETREESRKRREKEKAAESETVKKARGGYVKAADGIAKRGKTKGRMI